MSLILPLKFRTLKTGRFKFQTAPFANADLQMAIFQMSQLPLGLDFYTIDPIFVLSVKAEIPFTENCHLKLSEEALKVATMQINFQRMFTDSQDMRTIFCF